MRRARRADAVRTSLTARAPAGRRAARLLLREDVELVLRVVGEVLGLR